MSGPEVVPGNARLAWLANAVAQLIEQAVETRGLEVDEAVSVTVQVAADYARGTYGVAYLPELGRLVVARGEMPMPAEEHSA